MGWQINIKVDPPFTPLIDKEWLKGLVVAVLSRQGVKPPVELGVVVTGDEEIRELNVKYLGRDYVTDVLAFPLNAGGDFLPPPNGILHLGEVIICYPQAVRQGEEYGHSVREELALLVIHGVLHLLGYDEGERMKEVEGRLFKELIP
jgi:probable rRNA maturation factor